MESLFNWSCLTLVEKKLLLISSLSYFPDPDLKKNDGVYSRYLTNFDNGPGRYVVSVFVDDNDGQAFTFQWPEEGGGPRSCLQMCGQKGVINKREIAKRGNNQLIGPFTRIVRGDSFRITTLNPWLMPPARILDLESKLADNENKIRLKFTAVGDDYDSVGSKHVDYHVFASEDPTYLYKEGSLQQTNVQFSQNSLRNAGEDIELVVTPVKRGVTFYYIVVAVDGDGNRGQPSNIVAAFVPEEVEIKIVGSNSSPSVNPMNNTSKKAMLYIVVGIVAFIVLCVVLVLIIVITYRRKKDDNNSSSVSLTPNSSPQRSMGVTTTSANGDSNMISSPGFAVCDENEMIKESHASHYLLSSTAYNTSESNNGTANGNSVSFADDNNPVVNSSTYGWTELNNPYVTGQLSQGSTLPTYRDFQNGGFSIYNNSVYARPIPKNLRAGNVYMDPNGAGVPPSQSPSAGSSLTRDDQDRVPSISPPLVVASGSGSGNSSGEQTRLISSLSNTPTKSILKKPRNQQTPQQQQQQHQHHHRRPEDQSSQSSAGGFKEERSSESSNVSFSDRGDSPANNNSSSKPDFSPSNTYLETSFEKTAVPPPPPTLPKPKLASFVGGDANDAAEIIPIDRKVRHVSQV